MSVEQNKAAMRRFYDEAVNQRNLDLIDELIGEAFVEHEVFPGLSDDREGVRQFFTIMHEAFDGFRMDLQDLVAESDKVVARLTMRGTHKGEFMGVAGTGRKINVTTIDFVRFADGKAVEHWGATDGISLMDQIGGQFT